MTEQFPVASANVVTDPIAEEAYRQQMVGEFIEASMGTVGLSTALDLTKEGYAHMEETSRDRFQKAHPEIEDRASIQVSKGVTRAIPGYGQFGDRPVRVDDYLEAYMPKHEGDNPGTLQFFKLPDGNTDVRYTIRTDGYTDSSGRNTIMDMSFILNGSAANRLSEVVRLDPRFADELVIGQAIALGIPKSYAEDKIAPRQNLRNRLPATVERTLNVEHISYDESGFHKETEQLSFANSYGKNRASVIPESGSEVLPILPQAIEPEAAPVNIEAPAVAAGQDALDAYFEEQGAKTPQEKLLALSENMDSFEEGYQEVPLDSEVGQAQEMYREACEQLFYEYRRPELIEGEEVAGMTPQEKIDYVANIIKDIDDFLEESMTNDDPTFKLSVYAVSYRNIYEDLIEARDREAAQ